MSNKVISGNILILIYKTLDMKFNIVYTVLALALVTIISLSNSAGRAGGANQGNTGAPGDQMTGNNPRTCQSCHATGDIQVLLSLDILDANNNPITAYIPNEIYTARVSIDSAAGPKALGYGFQMVSLLDTDNSDVNGWTASGHSENVQIEASSNTNRVYAEHKGTSDSNEFLVQWQAPAAGKGDISFYAVGNGVNRNGSTSGDGATPPEKLTLTESIVSSVADLSTIGVDLHVAPNPVINQVYVTIKSEAQRVVTTKIMNTTGQVFYQQALNLSIGKQIIPIDLSQLGAGIYFLQTTSEKVINTQKIIKL